MNSHREYLDGFRWVLRFGSALAVANPNVAADASKCSLTLGMEDWPPNLIRRFHASFGYQAGSWSSKRRVVAKIE